MPMYGVEPEKVLIDHDGGIDDFPALALLVATREVDVKAITYCQADSYEEPALAATKKIVDFLRAKNIVIAGHEYEGVNPFVDEWRQDSFKMPNLPLFENLVEQPSNQIVDRDAAEVLVEFLSRNEPFTVVATGPLTNLANALVAKPSVAANIRRLFMMGGAVDVAGNVEQKGHDGSAEWNIYNNPSAADIVFSSGIPITMIGLDATNKLPLTAEFLDKLSRHQGTRLGRLWFETWNVAQRYINEKLYYFWDTLTSAVVLEPELVKTEERQLRVITEGVSQGRTVESSDGNVITVAFDADRDRVEQFYFDCLNNHCSE